MEVIRTKTLDCLIHLDAKLYPRRPTKGKTPWLYHTHHVHHKADLSRVRHRYY